MLSHFGGSASAVGMRRGDEAEMEVMGLIASMGGGLVEEAITFGGEERLVVAL